MAKAFSSEKVSRRIKIGGFLVTNPGRRIAKERAKAAFTSEQAKTHVDNRSRTNAPKRRVINDFYT